MRCIILACLFFALANANYFSKNRFYRLLNNYQQPQRYNDLNDDWYGDYSYGDDSSDYINDYDDIRRQNTWGIGRSFDWEDQMNGDMDQGIWGGEWNTDDTLFSQDKWYGEESTISRGLLKEVRHANHKLASTLYKQCKNEKDDKNTVVSPLSIQLALASLNKGARGNTKRQIGRVIAGSLQRQERRQVFNALARHVRQTGGLRGLGQSTRINPVTIIAINKRTPAQQWFIQTVRNQPGAEIKHCNFHNQPQQCRQMINSIVAQKTNMKINQIVPRDAITDNTKMVLVNAMEVKAPWGRQMRNHVTKEAKFYPLDTNKVKIVEVMETQGRFKYYEDELVKIVGIPTQGKEMTLYTIVPKHKDGLTAVEKLHLQDGQQLKELLDKTDLHTRRVGVQLPKFQIKHKIDARRTLRREGVTDAMDPLRADFTGINEGSEYGIDQTDSAYNRLNRFGLNNDDESDYEMQGDKWTGFGGNKVHLNKFIHQATIKITENGITSATQSGSQYDLDNFQRNVNRNRLGGFDIDEMNSFDDVRGLFGGDLMGQKMVKANRAFAFALKHNPTNQLVLVGRVIDAAQKKVNQGFQSDYVIDQL